MLKVSAVSLHDSAELSPELDGPAPELKSKPLALAKRRNIGISPGVSQSRRLPISRTHPVQVRRALSEHFGNEP
jgi:hypothetical protein